MTMTPEREAAKLSSIAELLDDADALLIDFNGTLADDEALIATLISQIAHDELGIELSTEQYFADLVGHTEERMFRELSGSTNSAFIGGLVDRFNQRYLREVRLDRRISLAAEAFVHEARARRKSVAVVTAASKSIAVPALAQIELLDDIDVVVALEDVTRSKPEPDCYLLALELLGVEAERAVAFEDSRTGLAAAHGAGMRVVAVGAGAHKLAAVTPYATQALDPALFTAR